MKTSLYPWKVSGKESRFVDTATGATLCEVRSRLDLPYHDPRVAETQLACTSFQAAACLAYRLNSTLTRIGGVWYVRAA